MSEISKKTLFAVGLLVALSTFIHFFRLHDQEFLGDEASPMLLIDRAWDAVRLRDVRMLAYPFLFYHDPFRALFSGTILELVGPDRILTRIPSIFWDISTLLLLVFVSLRKRIAEWIWIPLVFSFVVSGISMNGRLAGGDAQTRFLITATGILLYECISTKSSKYCTLAVGLWTCGVLTMLNTIVLFPGLFVATLRSRAYRQRSFRITAFCLAICMVLYFFLWAYIPIEAYKHGYQNVYGNRGLWYYFSRVQEGTSHDPLKSLRALEAYTSPSFAIGICIALLLIPLTKRPTSLALLLYPAMISVFLLNRSSFHVLMYSGLFLYGTLLILQDLYERWNVPKILLNTIFLVVVIQNIAVLFNDFLLNREYPTGEFTVGHINVTRSFDKTDEAVRRIYMEHSKTRTVSF